MARRRDESGQVVAAFAAVVTALLMLTALVVDLSPALVARLQQQESLSQAAQSCAAPASSLIVKNSEDPGGEIARQVASSMRESGFDGKVEVWFYEVPEGANAKVDQANRAFAWLARASTEVDTQLGALAGRSQFEVASGITGSASPYAKEKVWRPATARNGKWTLEAGQGAGSMRYEGMRLENMPDQLKDQLDQELAKM